MSSVFIRFPDGSREFRYPAKPIEEGDLLWHDGKAFRVLAIDDGGAGGAQIITVEPDSDDLGDVLQSERGGIVLEEFVTSS